MSPAKRDWIGRNLERFEVPGAVVSTVHHGKVEIFPFGVRAAGEGGEISDTTAFSIASCSKAFTAATVAALVEQGELGFDDLVQPFLPAFELDEPWLTEHVTLRDLLGMRLGLISPGVYGHGANRNVSASTILSKVGKLQRIAGFREAFTYVNQAYFALAEITSRHTGEEFPTLLRRAVLDPLGLKDTFVEEGLVPTGRDVAMPHARQNGTIAPLPEPQCAGLRGASCVYASGRDAARWLEFHLSGTTAHGTSFLSDPMRRALHSDHVAAPADAALGQNFQTYCMGWLSSDFQGRRIFAHEGGESGARAYTIFCPDEAFGVAIYASLASPEAVKSTAYHLLDQACDQSGIDWAQRFVDIENRNFELTLGGLEDASPVDPEARRPKRLEGTFESAANGLARLVESNEGLMLRFEDAAIYDGLLTPIGGAVYTIRCVHPAMDARMNGHGRVSLRSDTAGKVVELAIPAMAARFARLD